MSSMPARTLRTPRARSTDVTALIPDFPFEYGKFLDRSGRNALCTVANAHYGKQVLVVGAGVSGMVCAYELMRMGLHPVVEASDRIGGRLYSKKLGNPGDGVICELGGMRFPVSAKALFHYFEKVGVKANMGDFPNPGTEAAISTVVDYLGEPPVYYEATGNDFQASRVRPAIEEFFTTFSAASPSISPRMEAAMTEGSIDLVKIKRSGTRSSTITAQPGTTRASFAPCRNCPAGTRRRSICSARSVLERAGGTLISPTRSWNCCASSMAAWTPITGWPMTGPPACPSACGPCPRARWAMTWRTGPRVPAWKR